MRKPKGFNKMTLREQEIWLIAERDAINKIYPCNVLTKIIFPSH